MSTIRNAAIGGVAAALAIGGGFWTQNRENNSNCSDTFYTSLVHDEMRAEFLDESEYLAALKAGAAADNVSAEDRELYAQAAQRLEDAINKTDIVGQMKHPNNRDLQNCYLSLSFYNIFEDMDLGQTSTLGVPVDRNFEIIARFEIKFRDLTGTELEANLAANRKQWLVDAIEPGQEVSSARVASLTRRDFDIEEPEFVRINYNTTFIPETAIEAGYFGN